MTTLDWIFGIIGIIGTVFSVISFYLTDKAKSIEMSKNLIAQEKIRNLHMSLIASFTSADAIVQTSKKNSSSTEQLGDMVRQLRSHLFILATETKVESSRLRSWRFGKMIESQSIPESIDSAEAINNQG